MQKITRNISGNIATRALEDADAAPIQYRVATIAASVARQLEVRGYEGYVGCIPMDGTATRSKPALAAEIYSAALRARDPAAWKDYVEKGEQRWRQQLARASTSGQS